MQLAGGVQNVVEQLEAAGFETWCVGGAVRDHLLGIENHDVDIATAARPEDVQLIFPRTVPLGIDHGTIVVLDGDAKYEVTTFRKDKDTDGRHAKVEFGVSLDEDLARRDFTINAIAYHPAMAGREAEWRDPYNGRADIMNRVIRAVGDPTVRFKEDFLRILRMVRFSVRFEFSIDPTTWDAAKAETEGLKLLSAERVRDEWFGALKSAKSPNVVVAQWYELGALTTWLPDVAHPVIDLARLADPILATAYMSVNPGATLRKLRCTKLEIARVELFDQHRSTYPAPADLVAVRRWMATVGKALDDLVSNLHAKDSAAGLELTVAIDAVRAAKWPIGIGDLAVRGNDLGSVGVPTGKVIGDVLRHLLETVLTYPQYNNSEDLLTLARAFVIRAGVAPAALLLPGSTLCGLAIDIHSRAPERELQGYINVPLTCKRCLRAANSWTPQVAQLAREIWDDQSR